MIGQSITHYKILEKLGSGGMGEVYLAEDTRLERKVALKFLPPDYSDDAEFKSRFQHEAKATAALNHPNVVTVHDFGEHEGRMFIAMEHLSGQSLKELIESGSLTLKRALDVVVEICEGLAAAHKAGVVHRDIKPANIIVTDEGRAKILDFGLAKSQRATTETKVGSTIGTTQYESPEQSRGEESDQRSDIFSLGVVVYEMITGKLPFSGEYEAAVRYAITHETPEPLERFKTDIPPELQRIIDKALEKDPEDRYQAVSDLLVDFRRLKRDTGPRSRTTPAPERSREPGGKRVSPILVTTLIVLVVVAGYFVWDMFDYSSTQPGTAAADGKMLAVLPFQNLGADEDEYFADGITAEISARVARLRGLTVTARTSAGQYKGTTKSIKEIGAELGVDYMLNGTIRWDKSGDVHRVRITPQLIRVSDETFVWTDNIQMNLSQIFEAQAEIAIQIAAALDITLKGGERKQLAIVPTKDVEAYDSYLRGRAWLDKGRIWYQSGDSAIHHFANAIEIDPLYAEAYAWKALAHVWVSFYAHADNRSHASLALE
ncbi:MAG: protein kinase, partial [Candidatus Zixiibacteriota bacterium]